MSCLTLDQPLGDVPLFTTIPKSCWSHSKTLDFSYFHFSSFGVSLLARPSVYHHRHLPWVFSDHRCPAVLYILHSGDLPITTHLQWRSLLLSHRLQCLQLGILSFRRDLAQLSYRTIVCSTLLITIVIWLGGCIHFSTTRTPSSLDLAVLYAIGTLLLIVLSPSSDFTHGTSMAQRKPARLQSTLKMSSHNSKRQTSIRVHYVYHNTSAKLIHFTTVSVALFTATAQSESQKHVFHLILVSNYDLSRNTRNIMCIYLQLIVIFPCCYSVLPFLLSSYLELFQTFKVRHILDTRTYRPLTKRGPKDWLRASLFKHNLDVFTTSSKFMHRKVCCPASQPLPLSAQGQQGWSFQLLG